MSCAAKRWQWNAGTPCILNHNRVRALSRQRSGESVPGRYTVLGTDGFGRSDGRDALRDFFEVDEKAIVVAALKALADEEALDMATVAEAIAGFSIDPDTPDPVTR